MFLLLTLDSKSKHTLIKSADDTKLVGTVNTEKDSDIIKK